METLVPGMLLWRECYSATVRQSMELTPAHGDAEMTSDLAIEVGLWTLDSRDAQHS